MFSPKFKYFRVNRGGLRGTRHSQEENGPVLAWPIGMISCRETIFELLEGADSVSSADVQSASSVSRQAVWKQLRALVTDGQLVMEGSGAAVRYRLARREHQRYSTSEPISASFWSKLMRNCSNVHYVALDRFEASTFTTRAQAERLLTNTAHASFLVIDCDRVTSMSESFAQRLFAPGTGVRAQPINATPALLRMIERVRRREESTPKSDICT